MLWRRTGCLAGGGILTISRALSEANNIMLLRSWEEPVKNERVSESGDEEEAGVGRGKNRKG